MPSIFSPIPAEIERKAPGTGGKPPVTAVLRAEVAEVATTTGESRSAARASCCIARAPSSLSRLPAT